MDAILTVSELTCSIKKHLESRFPFVAVQGEISNFKEQTSGHLYFTLKDAQSQISAVLFKGNAKGLSRLPKSGDKVILKGEISLYSPRGTYQIIGRELHFLGIGELLLRFHELKEKLEKRGWFDAQRKKPIPKHPKTIGVITSPTGSVIQDILHVLSRRFSGFHLILNPVRVQGEGAAQEIALAIEQFNAHQLADVLIVGRGGGTLEDLWAFNEECVASAIYASQIPIVSAVGHETDFCLSDWVADMRAPTPSAAAEIVTQEKAQQLHFLSQTKRSLMLALSSQIEENKQQIDDIVSDLETAFSHLLAKKKLQLVGLQKQTKALNPIQLLFGKKEQLLQWAKELTRSLTSQILARRQLVSPSLYKKMDARIAQIIQEKKGRLEQLSSHLKAIHPKNLLTKGYCILFSEKKESVILSSRELHKGQTLHLLLHDGEAIATLNEIQHGPI